MKGSISIYVDGACRGNQKTENVGAWAYTIVLGDHVKENSCAYRNTTNNIMELASVIEALKALKPSAVDYEINIYSDSQYVVTGMNQWIKKWECNNWITSTGQPVANESLWRELLKLRRQFPVINFIKVKGHSDNVGNIRADELCNHAMDKLL